VTLIYLDHFICGNAGINSVVTMHRVRHLPDPAWKMTPKIYPYVQVGGCTDGLWTAYYYSRDQICLDVSVGSSSFRDLTSALNPKSNGVPCPAPSVSLDSGSRPRVIQLRPNTYHGRGLIPWIARSSFIITPSIYSPTKWA
jgi:hypothetical protein